VTEATATSRAIRRLIKKHAGDRAKELLSILDDVTQGTPPPLTARFEQFTAEVGTTASLAISLPRTLLLIPLGGS
jgi:hypothetical protein